MTLSNEYPPCQPRKLGGLQFETHELGKLGCCDSENASDFDKGSVHWLFRKRSGRGGRRADVDSTHDSQARPP